MADQGDTSLEMRQGLTTPESPSWTMAPRVGQRLLPSSLKSLTIRHGSHVGSLAEVSSDGGAILDATSSSVFKERGETPALITPSLAGTRQAVNPQK